MSITFYARSCCTLSGYGGELSIWMANDWPSDETDWKDWSQKSSAVLCKKFLVIDSAIVDITCVGSTSYSYVFVRIHDISETENINRPPDCLASKDNKERLQPNCVFQKCIYPHASKNISKRTKNKQ